MCFFHYLSFVLLLKKTLYRTELALDNSGISVAPPKRLRSTTIAIPPQPSITSRARRSDAKSKKLAKEMTSNEDDESDDENNDNGKENEDNSESNDDNESKSNESSDENGHQKSQNDDNDDKETNNANVGLCVTRTNAHFGKNF